MAFNPIAPIGDPIKGNTAVQNADGTVTLNGQARLTKQGQEALLRRKYEYNKEAPYLGKYGSLYADDDGFEAKGAGIMDYQDGFLTFNKKYNMDDQHRYVDKVRALPENQGREIYLKDSTHPSYMAPHTYKPKVTTMVSPLAPIK